MTAISWRMITVFALGITLAVSGCTAWSDSESESTEIVVEGESDAAVNLAESEQPAGEISISERLAENDDEAELTEPPDEADETETESGADEPDREPERDDSEPDVEDLPEEAEPIDPEEGTQTPIPEQYIHENDDDTETIAFELPMADIESGADDPSVPAVSSLQVEQGTAEEGDPVVRFHLGGEPVDIRFVDVDAIAAEVVGSNLVMVTGDIGDDPALVVQAQSDTVACETGEQQ
ncbi:hypothetical protein [Halalkalicoccus tibetensis]|uniref:Uncharacterized protein n=1 Tax=Halalkalicoccus tibetensis TaxID=175632 RepID=A0ABD5V706_9EURY